MTAGKVTGDGMDQARDRRFGVLRILQHLDDLGQCRILANLGGAEF